MLLTDRKKLLDQLKPHLKKLYDFSEEDFIQNFSSYYYNYINVDNGLFLFILYFKIIWTKTSVNYEERLNCLRNICLIIGQVIPFNHRSEYDFLARQLNFLIEQNPIYIYHNKLCDFQVYDFEDISFLTEHSIYFCYLVQIQLRNYYISNYSDLKISVSERIRNTNFITNFNFDKILEISEKYFQGVTFYGL